MSTKLDQNVILAIEAFQNGHLETAANLLNKALRDTPNNFDALLMLGVINGILRNFSKALDLLLKSLELDEKNNFVHFNLAKVYSDIGDEKSAIKHHLIATNLAPNHAEAWLNYGRSNYRLGNFADAHNCFQNAVSIAPKYSEAIASLASACIALNHADKALTLFDEAIAINPKIPGAWLMKADGLHELKKFDEAISHYDQAIKLKPDYAEAWSNKGITLHELKKFDEAISHYDQAIKLKPDYAEAWSNKGITLHELKKFDEAISHYDQAIKLKPDYAEAWSNKGITLHELKKFDEAISHYDQAIKLKPDYAEAWSNKGITLHELKKFDEAISHYDQAIKLKPDYAEAWSNKGITLHELKKFDEAISHYDQAIKLKPDYAEAWSNKGMSCILNEPDLAITCLEKATRIKPHYPDGFSNLGLAYCQIKDYSNAIRAVDIALSQEPSHCKAWANKGMILNEINKTSEALDCFETAYSKNPELKFLLGNLINNKLSLGDWRNIAPLQKLLLKQIGNNQAICAPFQLLSITDDPNLQKINANGWAQDQFLNCKPDRTPLKKGSKIKVGYYSPDFKTHPVGILLARVIELHSRNKFEIIGLSTAATNEGDPYTSRFKKGFDQFIDLHGLSDIEIAKISKSLNIDIAIDLGGYTKGSATSAFDLNLAPIQINYLGYAGTIGSDAYDYIIADNVVIPDSNQQSYSEKIIYLPNSFMPDDDQRSASSTQPKRSDFDLPNNSFIFACFNNGYKLNPSQLDSWAAILKNVPNSAIWLSKSTEIFTANIIKEFQVRTIDPDRIIFANRVDDLSDHLARLSLADLFLDTFPYNAHATAIDALRSGLPLLTLPGNSMASRVCASLLSSLQLPELIATDIDNYISKAIDFAQKPATLRDLKLKLNQAISSSFTFNTQSYTNHLESAFEKIYERRISNLPNQNISL